MVKLCGETKNHQTTLMKLIIVDFDDTLFSTPSKETGREILGNDFPSNFFRNPISMDTKIFDIKLNEKIANYLLANKNSLVCIVTGRIEIFKPIIENILEENFIYFLVDSVVCKDSSIKKRKEPYKATWLREFFNTHPETHPEITEVVIFEDNEINIAALESVCYEFKINYETNPELP